MFNAKYFTIYTKHNHPVSGKFDFLRITKILFYNQVLCMKRKLLILYTAINLQIGFTKL
jgi:hypothetical protein